jgi:hypothetical protein
VSDKQLNALRQLCLLGIVICALLIASSIWRYQSKLAQFNWDELGVKDISASVTLNLSAELRNVVHSLSDAHNEVVRHNIELLQLQSKQIRQDALENIGVALVLAFVFGLLLRKLNGLHCSDLS